MARLLLETPRFELAYDCLNNVPPDHFRFLANRYPDLVSRLHVQVRIMENFGLDGYIPWLTNTEGATCFVANKVWKLLITSFSSALGSKTTLTPLGQVENQS